jgi:glycerophosphoryl diester phosphodiesterase
MRQMIAWGLVLTGALFTAATAAARLETQPKPSTPAAGYAAGARVLVDAHNAYPSDGQFMDRIDRALSTGMPLAIEQDLVWYKDPATGVGRTIVSHGGPDAATAPTFEAYFFDKVKPLMEQALKDNQRRDWPLITLNLDFKTNEPEHHAAVWALLGKYEAWLTTAERTASPEKPAALRVGPMLVLTGSNDKQQVSFHDTIPVGQRLRLFGAIAEPPLPGADQKEKAFSLVAAAPDTLIPAPVANYRRWVNFPWGAVEVGGAGYAADWTSADAERLTALVTRAHAMKLWIRFYTLNGYPKPAGGYNFGSAEAAELRWKAAIEAGTDFLATDQYEELARMKTALRGGGQSSKAGASSR